MISLCKGDVMQSTDGVVGNVVKNPHFTPKCSPHVKGVGDFFLLQIRAPHPTELKLLVDTFDIMETSLFTGRLPSR